MKKNEKGILTIEASIVLTLFTLFVLFIFNFASIYTAQSVVSHATIQTADALAIESYLRETAAEGDVEDIVHLTSQITDSTSISADSFESLRTADVPEAARQKFVTAVSNSESKADEKLEALGVKDGLSGVDFNSSYVDLDNDDVIVAITYTLDLQFPVFGAEEITLAKTAKAKTFGDILYGVTTKPNNANWGVTSGDDEVEHGETVVITATPNHGYRFVSWNDGVTDNPRTVLVTEAKKYVAIFEPSGYGVNLSVNNADWGIATGGGAFDYMATATITATPKKHYQFVGWDYNGDGTVDHKEPTRNLVVNKTYDIVAIFEPVSYTITVNSNNSAYGSALATNSQGVSGARITAKYGSNVTLTATPSSSYYEFVKWSNGSKQSVTTIKVTGDETYTANFKLSTWTVNFYEIKGDTEPYATVVVYKDSSVAGSGKSMPDTSKLTNFARWRLYNGNDNPEFNAKTKVTSDLYVYAEYKCTVTLDANGGKINDATTKTIAVVKGQTADLPTPTKEHHTFKGWYTEKGGNGTQYTSSTAINGDITLYAHWSCNHTNGRRTVTTGAACTGYTYNYYCNICSAHLGSSSTKGKGHSYTARCDEKHYVNYFRGYGTGGCGYFHYKNGYEDYKKYDSLTDYRHYSNKTYYYCQVCKYCSQNRMLKNCYWCGPHVGSWREVKTPINGHMKHTW